MLRLGLVLPIGTVSGLANMMTAVQIGSWLRSRGMQLERTVTAREAIFHLVADEIGDQPVLYLEFGVFQGEATRLWSKLLRHPASVLHGFDSFEGLPQAWGGLSAGAFSTEGAIPVIDDPRVRFFKGWFDDVLPSYVPPDIPRVVMLLDADLYSSTAYVLTRLKALVRPGTFLYFDEFRVDQNEFRAFREFVEAGDLRFRLRASTSDLNQLLFQCVASSGTV